MNAYFAKGLQAIYINLLLFNQKRVYSIQKAMNVHKK